MKKAIGLLMAGVALLSVNAYASCGACPSDKPAAKAAAVCPVSGKGNDATCGGLKLSEEQKTKVAALKAECAKATCTSECKAKCEAGMSKILDAEQFKIWKASADKCVKPAKAADKVEKKTACCPGH